MTVLGSRTAGTFHKSVVNEVGHKFAHAHEILLYLRCCTPCGHTHAEHGVLGSCLPSSVYRPCFKYLEWTIRICYSPTGVQSGTILCPSAHGFTPTPTHKTVHLGDVDTVACVLNVVR